MSAGCSRVCRLFQIGQAVGAGCSRLCRQWMQAVLVCAGSGCRLFTKLQALGQAVPELARSGFKLFQSEQAVQEWPAVVEGCSRVCRQHVLDILE